MLTGVSSQLASRRKQSMLQRGCAALVWLGGTVGQCAAWGEAPAGLPQELIAPRAEERGMDCTRVIVQLRVDAPVGEPADSEQRRRAIASAREALFRELAPTAYRVTREYQTIPFVALAVSPEALQVLRQSALVVGVEADAVRSPQ